MINKSKTINFYARCTKCLSIVQSKKKVKIEEEDLEKEDIFHVEYFSDPCPTCLNNKIKESKSCEEVQEGVCRCEYFTDNGKLKKICPRCFKEKQAAYEEISLYYKEKGKEVPWWLEIDAFEGWKES